MNNNDAIIDRIKGIPAEKGTLNDKFDSRNPNKHETNDNAPKRIPQATAVLPEAK